MTCKCTSVSAAHAAQRPAVPLQEDGLSGLQSHRHRALAPARLRQARADAAAAAAHLVAQEARLLKALGALVSPVGQPHRVVALEESIVTPTTGSDCGAVGVGDRHVGVGAGWHGLKSVCALARWRRAPWGAPRHAYVLEAKLALLCITVRAVEVVLAVVGFQAIAHAEVQGHCALVHH